MTTTNPARVWTSYRTGRTVMHALTVGETRYFIQKARGQYLVDRAVGNGIAVRLAECLTLKAAKQWVADYHTAEVIEPASASASASAACPHEVRETVLTLTNWGHLYTDCTKPLLSNLAAKIDKGTFDAAKAVKAFRNIVETGMRDKEWNIVYGTWRPSVASRDAAAAELFNSYKEQLTELAYEAIGPEFLAVDVCEWGHDGSGNPTARHHVYTSTSDGGRVKLLSDRKCRRMDVGYGDRFDSCPDAMRKVGINPAWYEFTGKEGDRSADSLIANYRRRMVTI